MIQAVEKIIPFLIVFDTERSLGRVLLFFSITIVALYLGRMVFTANFVEDSV